MRQVADQIETVIVGKRPAVELALTAFLAGGHLLIEDIPGVGKTTLAKALARALGLVFKRVQFTPDLLPADITGTTIFNQKTAQFEFREGPVFANIVLADEINRATPKTQSSLLECMEEQQVTTDGITYKLPHPFFVVATENYIESHGTYPLPEAQLDRFLLRLSLGYPDAAEESRILDRQTRVRPLDTLEAVTGREEILRLQEESRSVFIAPALRDYIVSLVTATRTPSHDRFGGQPARLFGPPSCVPGLRRRSGPYLCSARRHQAPRGSRASPPPDFAPRNPRQAPHRPVYHRRDSQPHSRSNGAVKPLLFVPTGTIRV